jgi:hypothetical protein
MTAVAGYSVTHRGGPESQIGAALREMNSAAARLFGSSSIFNSSVMKQFEDAFFH